MYCKSLLKNGTIVIAAALFTLAACRRDKTTTATTTTTPALTNVDDNGGYASDAAKMESTSNDVISIADNAATYGSANLRTTSGYPTVTNDTSVTPHVLTINFGPTDHLCLDGKNRKGEIIVTYSGRYKDSGSTHTISYNSYYIDDMQLTGGKTVTNEGTNSSGQVWYTVSVTDSMTLASDSIVSWTGSRTRTWTAGYSTSLRSDDVYAIAGTTTIKRANGHTFTFTITTPLKVAANCAYIESGVVDISSSSFTGGDRTLDYGYGTTGGGCDAQAQLTIGAHSYVILLR